MAFSPETAQPLNELAEVLLRAPNSLSTSDRELIATYVSSQNDCDFCQRAHNAVAAYRLEGNENLVDEVKPDFQSALISDKLKALLAVAGNVKKGGKSVTSERIEKARQQGATDKEIHDTVFQVLLLRWRELTIVNAGAQLVHRTLQMRRFPANQSVLSC